MLAFACYIYVIVAMTNNPLLKRLSSLIKSEFAIKKIIKFTYGYLQVSGNKRVVLDLYDYKNEQLNLIVTQNFKSIIRKIILKYKKEKIKEKIKEKFMIIVEKHGENFDYYIVPITTSCIINVKDYIRLNYGVLASISYFDIFPEVVIDDSDVGIDDSDVGIGDSDVGIGDSNVNIVISDVNVVVGNGPSDSYQQIFSSSS